VSSRPSESALDAWLSEARDAVAERAGVSPAELDLDQAAVDQLLELARLAAHESGDRRNAPLLCFLVGRAGEGVDLGSLVNRIERVSAGPP
jgi:Domain of unknown function (DUF6457)